MKRLTRTAAGPVAVGAALVLLAACGEGLDDNGQEEVASDEQPADDADDEEEEEEEEETEAGDGNDQWPDSITYGLLPTSDEAGLATTYEPFETYMSACLDHPFELFAGTNYTAMIEAMRGGDIHVGKFGAFSYILASERANAEALVQPLADADDAFYTSMFVTLESNGLSSLADLEGEPLAFVDAASTSGHLFPRSMMIDELGITNDEVEDWLGNVVFSGGHDASLLSVLNEDVAAAPVSSNQWVLHVESGEDSQYADHPNFDDLVILAETEDIPRTVEAVQGDLPDDLKTALEGCFTAASDEPDLGSFLEEINAPAGYYPVADSAYDVVRDTATALGMSPEELLED